MTRRVGPLPSRVALIAAVAVLPACPFCDDVDQFLPQGSIEPAVLDLGPITTGTTCPARLAVKNGGNADLEVIQGTAKLADTDGSFTIQKVPTLVRLGASEELIVDYTAGATVGVREGTRVEIGTNDRDNPTLSATVTAFVASEPVALARATCDETLGGEDPVQDPCTGVSFGGVPISEPQIPIEDRAGANLSIIVNNDGNKELEIATAVLGGGNGDFQVVGARRGSQVVPFPVTVPPSRSGDCGDFTGNDATVLIDVRFAPVTVGASTATLTIVTNGAEGATIDVTLLGQGADTGILTDPPVVRFADVAEGATATEVVRVSNTGTAEAGVIESCLDLEGDGVCDGLCTADERDVTLGGTLACEVKTSSGDHEGKGFLLGPSDAAAGGDDERTVEIHWSPSAAEPAIPTTTVLLLKSNIEGNRVFEVGVVGANAGVLEVSSDSPCGANQCLQAEGAADDVTTWTGSLTLTLLNAGEASLTLGDIAIEAGTAATIVDDWTLGAPGATTLAPGASTTLTLDYANLDCRTDPCEPIDVSGVDGINLIISHNGALGRTLASIAVVPPQ